jgi:hypothetical protein
MDEHIASTMLLQDQFGSSLRGALRRQIGSDLALAVDDHDARPRSLQRRGDRCSDRTGAPGHDGNLLRCHEATMTAWPA